MSVVHHVFDAFVVLHITAGAPGLISFWGPMLTKKGSRRHSAWGKFFTVSMLLTASFAVAMATLTIFAPMATHPQLADHPEFSDPALVRGVFGWMMLYLAILTINLAWYGWSCIRNRADHAAHLKPLNAGLHGVLTAASLACAVQGALIGQWMLIGISIVGFATVVTNLRFMLMRAPGPKDWLLEHIKGIVGVGISVYTAFFAFGAVRIAPEWALTPALWSAPLVTGLAIIIYHQQKTLGRFGARRAAHAPVNKRPEFRRSGVVG
ncbi:MAG: hypothetical protein AAFR11_02480 [Pseudomonadota bacterium]